MLGKVFWSDGIASMSGDEPWSLDERLHALERKEFVRRERRSAVEGARQYAFVHALVRDTAYGQIPRADRARSHRLAAEWIASLPGDRSEDRAEVLAYHLGSAIEYGTAAGLAVDDLRPAAADALREAGDRAWSLGLPLAAAGFYRRALDMAPALEPDPGLLFVLGRSLVLAQNTGETELEQAVDGLLARGDVTTAAEALVALHEVRWVGGRTGTELLERATDLVGDDLDTHGAAYVVGSLGRFYGLAGRVDEAIELDERAIAGAERVGDRRLYAWALNNRGVARFTGGDAGGVEDIERALEIGLEIGSVDVGRCRINLGSCYDDLGDIDRAHEHVRAGLAYVREVGIGRFERLLGTELLFNRFLAGRWTEALELVEEWAEDVGEGYHESLLKGVPVLIRAERGESVDSGELEDVSRRAREIADAQVLIPWLAVAARALATIEDTAAAHARFDELIPAYHRDGNRYVQGPWIYDAAVTALLLGRGNELLQIVDPHSATRWSDAALAMLSGEPLRAADALASIGAFDEAGARVAAAEAFTREGRHQEAVAQAARARSLYEALGATPGVARAEALAAVA